MKIDYKQKDTFLGKKTEISIFDFEGMEKELKSILDGLKVVNK